MPRCQRWFIKWWTTGEFWERNFTRLPLEEATNVNYDSQIDAAENFTLIHRRWAYCIELGQHLCQKSLLSVALRWNFVQTFCTVCCIAADIFPENFSFPSFVYEYIHWANTNIGKSIESSIHNDLSARSQYWIHIPQPPKLHMLTHTYEPLFQFTAVNSCIHILYKDLYLFDIFASDTQQSLAIK